MSDPTPQARDSDDARPDDGAPTDAVSDEVKEDAAEAESGGDPDALPGGPALTHP